MDSSGCGINPKTVIFKTIAAGSTAFFPMTAINTVQVSVLTF